MDGTTALRLLQAMIDYFEAGNPESDAAAKAILEHDFENSAQWETAVRSLRQGVDWTGLRAPEAEVLSAALRFIQGIFEE